MTTSAGERLVTFLQYAQPALKGGEYTITARQTVKDQPAPNSFEVTRRFAVAAERFSLDPAELAAVFPPDLSAGELSGALPHVLITRPTLPWQRSSVAGDQSAPWLAVLVFDESEAPKPATRTAKDLIKDQATITVAGSAATGTGALPDGFASYPAINPLDYGESPDDPCVTIDIDAGAFSTVVPSAADLPFLAHIRQTDTVGGQDSADAVTTMAVVLGNRIPRDAVTARAYLVSLEGMGALLPGADGRPAPALANVRMVRLLTYRWWSFTATTAAATFASLLRGVNAVPPGQAGPLWTLQLPFAGPRPDAGQVQEAMSHEAAGQLTGADPQTLSHDAFGLGYVPLVHRLRHGGQTLSWYRGPLVPLPVTATVRTPILAADAATRYNPQTGMFDVSYAAAWQLGRLLALQSRNFSVALREWRRQVRASAIAAAEQARHEARLGGAFASVLGPRAARLTDPSPPAVVVDWLARLALLYAVPFNYLVPDERMLPPESLRVFHLDRAWTDALADGALSVGRVTSGDLALDAAHAPAFRALADARRPLLRANPGPAAAASPAGEITGFLLRSAAVAGWPDATVTGYGDDPADGQPADERRLLRSARLGNDVLLCLFDGVIRVVAVREPPGQLHCGVEGPPGELTTTLRAVTGDAPGHQYTGQTAAVPARGDGRTLQVAAAAASIKAALDARSGPPLAAFTSAEFALEMVQGVIEVEFHRGG
jgi:hypothetical protein